MLVAMVQDSSVHSSVSDHRLQEIHEHVSLVDLLCNLMIDNSEFQNERTMDDAVKTLLPF